MSVLRISIDRVHRQDSRRQQQLLALFALRRDLESRSSNGAGGAAVAIVMEQPTTKHVDHARTIRELRELIAALDRRVPRVERVGEMSIAQAAAELKSEALKRIEELQDMTRSGLIQAGCADVARV
jgi:hypothetical protein